MDKKLIIFFAVFLLLLNIFCWREVFVLATNSNLKVDFLDVGQGDSAFIITPENHQVLIDGGPDSTILRKLAENMPFWDRTIDLVILSHPEKDHMQGLIDVFQRYKIDYILWTGVKKSDPEYEAWMKVLEKQEKIGAKIIIAELGQKIRAGNVLIYTLYPLENLSGQEMRNTSNDKGVVCRLVFGKNSFLFTGDISTVAEKNLVDKKINLVSEVLKVAHHGSKYSTSEEFLAAVGPKVAVISVGAKNTYGHPTPEVLQKLDNFRVKTLRTDQKGDITILSDGNNVTIKNN
jgi:competence protein ComEC